MKAFPCEYMEWNPDAEYSSVMDPLGDPIIIQTIKGRWEQKKDSGMDLRDYFAAKAMPVIMLDWYEDGLPPGDDDNGQSIAELSYLMADAMMKARGNK